MALTVFFTADDLGLDRSINDAIFHSHQNGALSEAGLMMGQPGTVEAVERMRDFPNLKTGLHLHLCDSVPLTISHWPWKNSPARAGIALSWDRRARARAREEIRRQWDAYRETGLACHFLNSHHHLHAHPVVFDMIGEIILNQNPLRLRLGELRFFEGKPDSLSNRILGAMYRRCRAQWTGPTPHVTWGLDRTFRMNAREIRKVIGNSVVAGQTHEFIFHPRSAPNDADTRALIELKEERE